MNNKKKLFARLSQVAAVAIFSSVVAMPVMAANRDFTNIKTNVVTTAAVWQKDAVAMDTLIEDLIANPKNYVVEFNAKNYSYEGLNNALINKPANITMTEAFTTALKDESLVVKPNTEVTATVVDADSKSLMGLTIVEVSLGDAVDGTQYDVTVKGVAAKYYAASKSFKAKLEGTFAKEDIKATDMVATKKVGLPTGTVVDADSKSLMGLTIVEVTLGDAVDGTLYNVTVKDVAAKYYAASKSFKVKLEGTFAKEDIKATDIVVTKK